MIYSFQRLPPRPSLLERQAFGLDRLPHLRLRDVLRHVRDPVAARLEGRGERVERGSELVGDRGLAAALLRRRDELRAHEGAPLGRRQILPPRLLPDLLQSGLDRDDAETNVRAVSLEDLC